MANNFTRSSWTKAAPATLAAFLLALGAQAEVKLPHVFGHDMVLQRDQKVPVWGTAAAGEKVSVSFAGQKVEAIADGQGRWRVDLAPLAASAEGRTFLVEGARTEQISSVAFTNVVVGEVWFCSGQSNMAFTMSRVKNQAQEIAAANHPLLRHFRVARKTSNVPLDDVNAKWEVTTSRTTPPQSAVAYFFGETLMKELKVPVGLINASWGGTRIEPWTPAGHPDDLWMLQHLWTGRGVDTPTVLWNGMVSGLVPYAIKGAIWYQGCSNRADGDVYLDKTVCLVRGWRREWGQGDFPYFLVQLAPFKYNNPADTLLPVIQEAQARVPEKVPNSGYTVINDVGNVNDIHPTDKRTVGMRLADQALDRVYGRRVRAWETPTFKSARVDGTALRVTLDHAQGLKTRDGKPATCFELRDLDGRWVPAQAKIEGCDVVLTAAGVDFPNAMRFAAHNGSTPNLVNGDGLPAGPFHCGAKLGLDALEKLPDLKGMTCVQRYDIPEKCAFARQEPPTLATVANPKRVAYLFEAETSAGEFKYVCAVMDAFAPSSADLVLTGKPRNLHRSVQNLVVRTNVPRVAAGDKLDGFLEFYSSNYGPERQATPAGGDDRKYDFNDTPRKLGQPGYGCLQLHDLKSKSVIFAFNHFNSSNNPCDIGFGTNPDGRGQPDWTFSRNAGSFKARRISVWVK